MLLALRAAECSHGVQVGSHGGCGILRACGLRHWPVPPSLPPSTSPFLHKSEESIYNLSPFNRPLALSQEKIKSKRSAQDDARVRSGGRGEAGAFLWRRGRHAMPPRSWPPGSSRRQSPRLPHGSHAELQYFTASSSCRSGISNSNWKSVVE